MSGMSGLRVAHPHPAGPTTACAPARIPPPPENAAAPSEAVDFEGTARPQGVQRDIGAFEYKP